MLASYLNSMAELPAPTLRFKETMLRGRMQNKLKLLFVPFLLIGVSFISLYTFFNWFLFIKLELFPLSESIRNFGLPMILLWIPILKWLKPRINLLDSKKQNRRLTYDIVAWILIACPAIIAQEYMSTATGKLTELSSINEISHHKKSKFYTVKNYFVFKKGAELHPSAEVTGRYNQHLRWSLHVAFPIYESRILAIKYPAAWLGIKYTEEIDNRLSDEEKVRKFEDFLKKSEEDVNQKDLHEFLYLDRISSSDRLDGYLEAVKNSPKLTSDNSIVLIPVNEPFALRNGSKPFWLCVSFFLGAFIWLLMLWKPKLNRENYDCYLAKKPIAEDRELRKFLTYFIPRKDCFITPILLNLNFFIFLLMVFSGAGFMSLKTKDLLNWGANYGPYIAKGEYWRLLGSTFLHGGIIHLVCNMFGLVFLGICLEPALGKSKFIFVYLLTGVMASLASNYWYTNTVGVGSSGAIMGLYGVFLAILMPKTLPSEIRDPFLGIAAIYILSNLIMGFIIPGIDNAAHLGGFVSGFIIGLMMDRNKKTALNLMRIVKTESDSIIFDK